MTILWLDTETYSEKYDLKKTGGYVYSTGAKVLVFQYAFDDEEPVVIDMTEQNAKIPDTVIQAFIDNNVKLVAHNSNFDRNILINTDALKDYPKAREAISDIKRWFDTMAIAAVHSLPLSLADLGAALGISVEKAKLIEEGKLINTFCKPCPLNRKLRRATKETHPEEWKAFLKYAKQDIIAMRECYKRLPLWNMSIPDVTQENLEGNIFWLDQLINDRGVQVDVELARSAVNMIENEQKVLAKRAREITGGVSPRQVSAIIEWLQTKHGIDLPDLTKSTVAEALRKELPEEVRELLEIRQQSSVSSTSKYTALLDRTSPDRRVRGTIQYCGATRTGRFAGRGVQFQNLPRPSVSEQDILNYIEATKHGHLGLLVPDVIKASRDMLRGCICAKEGHKLVASDLSNIEGRVLAWIAGETWKIQAFYDYDKGIGHDLYKLAYSRAFNKAPEDVTKEERAIGKVMELSLGYGGGVNAYAEMAKGYGVDLEEMAKQVLPTIPLSIRSASHQWYKAFVEQNKLADISEEVFIACDSLKRLWRQAHPKTVLLWQKVEKAATEVSKPWVYNKKVRTGYLLFDMKDDFMRIKLPGGRFLCYHNMLANSKGLSYRGQDNKTKKYTRIDTFGGKLVENITQAIARDILVEGMNKAEQSGYTIVMTVHDEIVAEVPDSAKYTSELLSEIMACNPSWAQGLPLAAEGYESYRYRK